SPTTADSNISWRPPVRRFAEALAGLSEGVQQTGRCDALHDATDRVPDVAGALHGARRRAGWQSGRRSQPPRNRGSHWTLYQHSGHAHRLEWQSDVPRIVESSAQFDSWSL